MPKAHSEKDKLDATIEATVAGPNEDDSTLEMNADQERAKVAEAIKAAREHVEKAKARSKNKAGGYRVKLILTKMERMRFKAAYRDLGEEKASDVMYRAVLNAAK